MAETKRAKYRFTVKEGPTGRVWLMAELQDGEDVFGDGSFVGFDLRPDASIEEAQAVARYLNEHLTALALTRFP